MIKVSISGLPLAPIIKDLRELEPRILAACRLGVKKSLDEIQRISRTDYLSGPRPVKLGVVTGRLKRSIQPKVKQGGHSITGTISSDTPYSKYHEFGFRGRRRVQSLRRGTPRARGMVNYAGRPFLGPAFRGHIPSVTNNLLEALKKA